MFSNRRNHCPQSLEFGPDPSVLFIKSAAGKSASLVLTDGDLLEQTTTVEQVWIDGQAADMDDVQKAAYRHWSSRPLPDES